MDTDQIDAYLARIGAARPARPDADRLRELQRAHLFAVPFENLSIHLNEPIQLDEESLLDKIVTRRRGGFCYELNGAFAALLTALGFPVAMLSGRVHGRGRFGPPFDHLGLRVELAEPWFVDVGYGAFSHHPLRLDVHAEQRNPGGVFQVETTGPGDIEVAKDGRVECRFESRPYELVDFIPTCWWHQSSPESHFTKTLTCSLPTETGRVTLSGDRLIKTATGERSEQILDGDADVLAAYRDHFGVILDRPPALPAPAAH
ncbi:MAG TPA: arylamine N-acetyltransferase [Mycobacteriales bacterium]|nr:arylamine N-acetyltransferase [Mycobacteriales bacterium]